MMSFLERNLDPRYWLAARRSKNDEELEIAASGENFFREGGGGGSNGQSLRRDVDEAEKTSPREQEEGDEWEIVPRGSVLPQTHPLDPHKPSFSSLLPEPLRPYPAFEGWFIRIWDATNEFSAAVIMATNYATDESQVTILFAPGKGDRGRPEGRASVQHGFTYAVAVKTKVGSSSLLLPTSLCLCA